MFQEGFAHQAVPLGSEDFAFEVLNFVIFFLLVDDHRPAAFFEGLGGDFRANIVDFGHAEERALVVFHGFGDVVTERRQTRLAAEVMVGITQLARFQGFGICLA